MGAGGAGIRSIHYSTTPLLQHSITPLRLSRGSAMTLTLELPPDLEQRVREAAERGGFATAQEYIFDLLEQATPSAPATRRRTGARSRRKAPRETDAEEEAAMGALLAGEGEIPPPIPLAEIRGVRHDVQFVREIRGGEPYEYYPLGE